MQSYESGNKRIAKNTLFLYIRMLLSLIVSLYTSRVVLQTLGFSDYGIYSLVGGVVVIFSFLNSSLSGATSRFLTYELGRGNLQRLKETFSSAIQVHLFIALIVFILAETLGLWFFTTKLVIPEERMFAAHVVYQCSIISTIVQIVQVPYDASIIAHEKMNIYAYIELLSVLLRLVIVYLLLIGDFDKLELYAVLVLSVQLIVALIYRSYSVRRFEECRFLFVRHPETFKSILNFSSWNLYVQLSSSVRQLGLNSLVNIFFGVIYNASSGIATTVDGAIAGFCTNVITAFRPQITKSYAQGKLEEMMRLMVNASKYSQLLYLVIALPLLFELPYVFEIWLGDVPPLSVEICRLLIITNIFFQLTQIIHIAIHATGNIKLLSLSNGTLLLFVLLPVLVLFRLGYGIESAYICMIALRIVVLGVSCVLLKRDIPEFPIKRYLSVVFLKIVFITIFACVCFYGVQLVMQPGFLRLSIIATLSLLLFSCYTYCVVVDSDTREKVKLKLLMLFSKKDV